MSEDKQRYAEQISAEIIGILRGYFQFYVRTKIDIFMHPKDTWEQRKTAEAYEKIAQESGVRQTDVEGLLKGEKVEISICQAICNVLIAKENKHDRERVVALMERLPHAHQHPAILIPKTSALPAPVAALEDRKAFEKKDSAKKTPEKGWSPIKEVVEKYAGDPKKIEQTIQEVPRKAIGRLKTEPLKALFIIDRFGMQFLY